MGIRGALLAPSHEKEEKGRGRVWGSVQAELGGDGSCPPVQPECERRIAKAQRRTCLRCACFANCNAVLGLGTCLGVHVVCHPYLGFELHGTNRHAT